MLDAPGFVSSDVRPWISQRPESVIITVMPQVQPAGGLVGRTLGSYRVIASLGSGGMGEVYLAEDVRLQRRVALKVLPPDMAAHPEKLQRFEREARAVASLSHPSIVVLHSIEEAESLRFLTMEHVEGETLGRAIPARGFPIERFLSLAIALTDAVAAAHRQGILHRDLKPENVMLTAEGRLKVLDFGLAKLRADAPEEGDHTTRETQSVTQDGRIVGTVAYMSPEQAQGLPVDHRSDVFSLGILLYEMASGERPFKGHTNLSVLSSILKDTPRPVSELREEVPRPLARMIQRCLEKLPEDRYQSASDLRRDLEDLKRDLDTGELLMSTTAGRQRLLSSGTRRGLLSSPVRRRFALPAAAAVAIVVLSALAFALLHGRKPTSAADGRRSLAVFYFDNLSGDPRLDWLRSGLTDMLVTNLSQGAGLRVLSTARLFQLLEEAGHRDDRAVSAKAVEAVSRRAQATTALVGSFVRAGSQIRIQASLQDPVTGELIASERVEGDAENGLFGLVDELTGKLRGRLEPRATRLAEHDRKIEEVTTGSIDAYKAYAEGSRLHERLQEREAQGYFEKAVEADPGFAMALAKLSVVHANLDNMDKAREYSSRAVEKAGQLPPAERYYIEGRHYSLDPSAVDKAIAAYQKAVDEAPDHTAARNNLAQMLLEQHRYPEGLMHLEELRRRGMSFPGTWMSLAEAYAATGQPEKAREALGAYVREHPDRSAGYENLGLFELSQQRLAAALEAFDRAASLGPDQRVKIQQGRFVVAALQDRWPDAEAAARELTASRDPRERWSGGEGLALASLYRGDVGAARRLAEQGVARGTTTDERVGARLFRAKLELELGRCAEGLAEADRAVAEAHGERKLRAAGQSLRAVCLAKLGKKAEAEQGAAEVESWLATVPKAHAELARLQLRGEMALAAGDHVAARRLLQKAAELPPPMVLGLDPQPVEVQYALARATLAAGDDAAARHCLKSVLDAGPARVRAPICYVRSLALLAALEQKQGRALDARRLYERYLGYWKNGQIDRAEVLRAGQRLAALRSLPA